MVAFPLYAFQKERNPDPCKLVILSSLYQRHLCAIIKLLAARVLGVLEQAA